MKQTRAHSSRPGAIGPSSALLESRVLPHGVVMKLCITRKRPHQKGSTFSPHHTPKTHAQWEEGGVVSTSQEIAALLLYTRDTGPEPSFPPTPSGSSQEGAGESSFPELLEAPAPLCSCPLSASCAWLTCTLSLTQAVWIAAAGLQSQPKGGPTHPVTMDALCPSASFLLLGFPRSWSPPAANQTQPVGGRQATRQE